MVIWETASAADRRDHNLFCARPQNADRAIFIGLAPDNRSLRINLIRRAKRNTTGASRLLAYLAAAEAIANLA
eukprot:8480949-Lingulodinium_polyedra.AAC.1